MKVYNTKYSIQTTCEEDNIFNECYEIINGIMAQMASHNCDEMMCDSTGEVVDYQELRRMLGILEGLPYMTSMYKAE